MPRKHPELTAVFDESIGAYRILGNTSDPFKQPGVELATPTIIEGLRSLRKAKGSDYVRHAAYEDPRGVLEVAGVLIAAGVAWEIGAMIASGLAGLNPAGVFQSAENLGGQALSDLNPLGQGLYGFAQDVGAAGSSLAGGVGQGVSSLGGGGGSSSSTSPPSSGSGGSSSSGGGGGGSSGGNPVVKDIETAGSDLAKWWRINQPLPTGL